MGYYSKTLCWSMHGSWHFLVSPPVETITMLASGPSCIAEALVQRLLRQMETWTNLLQWERTLGR
jgi:hypothetical protein